MQHERLRPVKADPARKVGVVVGLLVTAFLGGAFLGGPVLIALFVSIFAVMQRTAEWWIRFWWG